VFHGGLVQGYRGAIALLPERDVGVVVLWNSSSAAPSGLLPTILDRAIGVTPQRWLDVEPEAEPEALSPPTETLPTAPPAASDQTRTANGVDPTAPTPDKAP
jgi:beta-lactamase class C